MSAALLAAFSILGTWQYAGFRYNGDFYPNPNPDLVLLFTFRPDGNTHLIWSRKNETGFCERRGIYRVDNDQLWQKTTWVNPANDSSCARDSDMQPDRETTNRIILGQSELAFVMELDGREFLYLLRSTQSVSSKKED